MRTSQQQFEMLITYMEQHGDLSKPNTNARGRMVTIKHWEDLKTMLNSDASGDTKSTEKWKKVWSDFKNNTKKKAARLHRAAGGTGGGPAVYAKLTHLEERVLNLIGIQAATGLSVEEAGITQDVRVELVSETPVPELVIEMQEDDIESWNQPGPSSRPHVVPPFHPLDSEPHFSIINDASNEGGEVVNQPPSTQPHADAPRTVLPALSGQSIGGSPRRDVDRSPRRIIRASRRRLLRRSPRRPVRPARTEEAAQHFLQNDELWREFKVQKHRDEMEMRRNQINLRETELQIHRDWQLIGLRIVDMLDKLVDKYCRE